MTTIQPTNHTKRGRRALAALGLALALSGCCADGKCIKEPPCRPSENPCCLTPIQKAALGKGHHALVAPAAYVYDERTYVLFTEKGHESFRRDPSAFSEKDAIRRVKGGKTLMLDLDPGTEVDPAAYARAAQPYAPPPKVSP
jgi:hypothetical protein